MVASFFVVTENTFLVFVDGKDQTGRRLSMNVSLRLFGWLVSWLLLLSLFLLSSSSSSSFHVWDAIFRWFSQHK